MAIVAVADFAYNRSVKLAKVLRGATFGLLSLVLILGWNVTFAQSEASRYFPETGHVVKGAFLRFYEQVAEAEFAFGYPITPEFTDPLSGRKVQYFQRVRLEWHPEERPELQVQLTPLGDLLYVPGQPLQVPTNPSACRSWQDIEYQVCYAFLDFFEAHGGVSQFGFPISNFEYQDERIVQYFNYARFTWHPELPPGQKVQLSDLGRIYFYKQRLDPFILTPITNNSPQSILGLKVRAFPEKALIASGDQQTISVIVQDQRLQPVAQAQVKMTLVLPDGSEQNLLMEPTDEHGISRLSLLVDSEEIGMAAMEITVTYGDFIDRTRTSFRVWW